MDARSRQLERKEFSARAAPRSGQMTEVEAAPLPVGCHPKQAGQLGALGDFRIALAVQVLAAVNRLNLNHCSG